LFLYFKVLKCISMMSSCLCLQIVGPKEITNSQHQWCAMLFFAFYCLTWECTSLWKKYWQEQSWSELKWIISSLWHSITFRLQFCFVWNLKMFLKFFQCLFLKFSWIGLFSYGDVNNAPRCLVKFHPGPIIIWRIWNECIMFVVDYVFMGWRIKHYWLMMNPTRHFKIQSGFFFFLNNSRDRCC
jgi:hypothetical protein